MVGHFIFLGIFYCVLVVIAATLSVSAMRAIRDFRLRRAEAICWQATFPDLPARERTCRHEFTGEFKHRTCDQAFDCRECQQHAALVAARPLESGSARQPERYYHRGHTWVQPEPDGTVTIGLDELGEGLVRNPDRLDLPPVGTSLRVNGSGWFVRKRGATLRILSPVDGDVIATGGAKQGWYLKVRPEDGRLDARHLLRGAEVRPWMAREVERLHAALPPLGEAPTMADGGLPVEDIAAVMDDARWEALCGGVFLQA